MENKVADCTLGDLVRLAREAAILFVLCYLAIKLFNGDLKLNFSSLSAVELVSILLAFFSICMSAAFYFAATSASSRFYDYVNKFNSQSSELLGRLEERLQNVHDKQDEIGSRINTWYLSPDRKTSESEAQSQTNDQQIMELQAGLEDVIKDLLARAGVEGDEKARFEEEIRKKDQELAYLREEQSKVIAKAVFSLKHYFLRSIKKYGVEKALSLNPAELFKEICPKVIPPVRRDMIRCGFAREGVETNLQLTEEGRRFIADIVLGIDEHE
ncbi:hypothetical protein [Pseudomonas sp. PA1(2017)]|uniref:hypothetical protein n=1 Tax=Pseudomonas sp. PA1(2017) TaxID=1932113 RepID=UPI0011152091|nr:hypothetical protein [Pseudomonas sp. PA1(2017)]